MKYSPAAVPNNVEPSLRQFLADELRRISQSGLVTLTGEDLADVAFSGDHGDLIGLADNDHPQYLLAASYTAADVLSKLLGVDGSGSGLDADLLDGNSSAYFLAASAYTAADVLSKLLTVDGAASGLDADLLDGNSSAYYLAASAYASANPSASVGLTAVNGSASTYMRSDGAPALSQAIAPTWTSHHIWADNKYARFGDAADMSVYHDGTNSVLSNATGKLILDNAANTTMEFNTNGALRMSLLNSGFLRLGDTAETLADSSAQLQLVYASNSRMTTRETGSNVEAYYGVYTTGGYLGTPTAHPLEFYTNSALRGSISSAGQLLWGAGSAGAPAYSFTGDPDTGLVSVGANDFGLYAGGNLQLRLVDNNQMAVYPPAVYMVNVGTTASAANAFINSGDSGKLLRSTSSIRYKRDVADLVDGNVIERLRSVLYKSTSTEDDPTKTHLGFIAEEVAEFAPELVHFNEKGQPESVQYERVVVPLVTYVRNLEARLTQLERT